MSPHDKFVPDADWPTIVELAIERWGQPNKKLSRPDDVRFGDKGSKSVKPSALIWKDHESGEGGGYVEMWRLAKRGAELPPRETGRPKPKPCNGHGGEVPPWENVGVIYHYHDSAGDLVLDVVRTRTGTPRFVQRAPDGHRDNGEPKWRWSVKHIPDHDCLLYRLPGLRASGDAAVWITEGEKDADRLTDELLIATTGIGGAGKWRDEYAEQFRGKPVVILQDNDQAGSDHAAAVARSLVGIAASVKLLLLPSLPEKGDVSDWLDADNTVEELIRLAREAPEYHPKAEAPDLADCLPFRWGASLTHVLDTQDFVEGLLTTSCLAVVYGDSNVGKSFWVVDLGLHVSGGIPWNGREVDQGIVVLVALEGGRSIDNRIIAARERLGLPPAVPIVVVQCPIDLRTNSADAYRLANTIKLAISQCMGPMPVRLVIIDTMSRALNGGAEGAEDMSALVANADRIRAETGVAILFVAHCGKDAAKGIRGWSGIRAAIDVEIEVTRAEDDAGFVAEVTKERDLPIGDRFGFQLNVVELGHNQRGKPVTTCVVVPVAAPAGKRTDKRKARMTDQQAAMLAHTKDLMARHGGPIQPTLDMPVVTGTTRNSLRECLLARGWFDEGQVLQGSELRKPAYAVENNALTALKRRGLLDFNRHFVWVP